MSALQLLLMKNSSDESDSTAYLPVTSHVNFVIDANSIWSSAMGPAGIDALPPFTAFKTTTGCTVVNTSIAGQQWYQMASNITDINAGWASGKINVLVAGETRNTIFNGKTASQCLDEIDDYLTAVRAAKDWDFIVMMGTLPSDGVPTAADENEAMVAVDDTIRSNLEVYDIAKFIRYRDLSAFSGDGASRQGFMTSTTTCLEDSPGPYVHPNGLPREQIAARMVRDLQLIPQ